MKKLILSVFAFLSLVCAPVISSAQDVKIGVLYPLTGPVAVSYTHLTLPTILRV